MGLRDERSNVAGVKPKCFGDPREHDPRDRVCMECRWQQTCGVVVKNRTRDERSDRDERRPYRDDRRPYRDDDRRSYRADDRRDRGSDYARPTRLDVDPDPDSYVERDDESLGFFPALIFNGLLGGMRAGAIEAAYAIDQIPRFPYQDPFKSAMERRRQAIERREDEERGRGRRDTEDDDE